jgi:hypothetical protein
MLIRCITMIRKEKARGESKLKLKQIGLQLCTCTWIEIMTGAGVALYLVLAMHNYVLAALAAGLFAPLIAFHFVITLISRRDGLISIEGIRRTNEKLESKMGADFASF